MLPSLNSPESLLCFWNKAQTSYCGLQGPVSSGLGPPPDFIADIFPFFIYHQPHFPSLEQDMLFRAPAFSPWTLHVKSSPADLCQVDVLHHVGLSSNATSGGFPVPPRHSTQCHLNLFIR